MTLTDALALRDREVISLVGGKDSSYVCPRKGTLLPPEGGDPHHHHKNWKTVTSPDFALFLSDQISEIKKWVLESLKAHPCLLIATERLERGKLQGIAPSWVEEIHSLPGVSVIIVEADGAAGRSLKAPRVGEPVLPPNTTLLVPVVGIDVLGCPLDEEHVFRSEIAARVLNVSKGKAVTNEMVAGLLSKIVQGRPEGARVIPFINKIDLPGGMEKGRTLGKVLLSIRQAQMERIILGQAQNFPVVKEIVLPPEHERYLINRR